jgi:predicted transcriptional regulator
VAQGTSSICTCDPRAASVEAFTCKLHAPALAAEQNTARGIGVEQPKCPVGRFPAAEQEHSEQSERAAASYVDWSSAPPSERPLRASRGRHAAALFAALKSRGISDERFAAMLGITKSAAQKYLSGEKPIPTTLLDASELPYDVRSEFVERISGHGRIEREIDRLDLDGALAAQKRIGERIAKLARSR